MKEKVSFFTSDGIKIVGDFYSPSKRAVLLLHMMPATKESWNKFSKSLNTIDFSTLAIDLRGHGESISRDGKKISFRNFMDLEHQESIRDLEAAGKFLTARGKELVAIVGASIGANLALWYQSEHPEIKKTVLLSPGFDYKGIKTEPLVKRLVPEQSLYAIGGSRDVRSAGEDCGTIAKKLIDLAPSTNKEVEVLETDAHGTDLFQFDPTLKERLIQWLGQ